MAIKLILQGKEGIVHVVDQLHDWWLDIDAIEWDRAECHVRIPFCRDKIKLASHSYDAWVTVAGVRSLQVRDTEKVGYYDLNRILVERGKLAFECGVPLRIEFDVDWVD
jgi:hypothetical protein